MRQLRRKRLEMFEDAGIDDLVLSEATGTFLVLPVETHRSLASWLQEMIQPSGGREMSSTLILRPFRDATGHEVSADALAGGLIQRGVLPAARFPAIGTPRGRLPTIWLFFCTFSRAYKIERQRQLERELSL